MPEKIADEFNRIDISVLSVVSTQWKCILDAIRSKKARFVFEEEDIVLNHEPFCSAYITVICEFQEQAYMTNRLHDIPVIFFLQMNPGYAGRTELPESVKALFRPCAMTAPDMDLIAEVKSKLDMPMN